MLLLRETLRVACFPVGVQAGEPWQRSGSPMTPLASPKGDALASKIPYGVQAGERGQRSGSPVPHSQIQIIPSLANRSMVACCVWRKCLRSTSPSSIVLAG